MTGYYSVNQYVRDLYGEKLYKLAVSTGFTCPNRDGMVGSRGCIFCSAGGSGEFAAPATLPVKEQLAFARKRIEGKTNCKKFIAYFQSFTNTYGDLAHMKKCFEDAVSCEEVAVLSVATRPDCLGKEVLDILEEMAHIKPVWVELGLQTSKKETVDLIRRGYDDIVYEEAVYNLRKRNIHVITHVILGLPGESKKDMLNTVRYVAQNHSDGIKLQLLHILRGTDLALLYERDRFHVLTQQEYYEIVGKALEMLPPDMVIHRLTGDGPKSILLEPDWSRNKKKVLNDWNRYMMKNQIQQGRLYDACKRDDWYEIVEDRKIGD